MTDQTVLKVLLGEQHMQEHKTFCREYNKVAKGIDPSLVQQCPSKATFYRWLKGNMQGLPHPGSCRVLEKMFPGWNARALLEQWNSSEKPKLPSRADATTKSELSSGLLSQIPSSMSITSLAGYWVTYFKFEGTKHHVDVSHLVPISNRRATITNHTPGPRSDGRTTGFNNVIEVELVNRHLVGTWKNVNDSYYFGTIHLTVLPGETILEGYYTGFENDLCVMANRWRWIRIDPSSLEGVSLEESSLRDPGLMYNELEQYSYTSIPIDLTRFTEGLKSDTD